MLDTGVSHCEAATVWSILSFVLGNTAPSILDWPNIFLRTSRLKSRTGRDCAVRGTALVTPTGAVCSHIFVLQLPILTTARKNPPKHHVFFGETRQSVEYIRAVTALTVETFEECIREMAEQYQRTKDSPGGPRVDGMGAFTKFKAAVDAEAEKQAARNERRKGNTEPGKS